MEDAIYKCTAITDAEVAERIGHELSLEGVIVNLDPVVDGEMSGVEAFAQRIRNSDTLRNVCIDTTVFSGSQDALDRITEAFEDNKSIVEICIKNPEISNIDWNRIVKGNKGIERWIVPDVVPDGVAMQRRRTVAVPYGKYSTKPAIMAMKKRSPAIGDIIITVAPETKVGPRIMRLAKAVGAIEVRIV